MTSSALQQIEALKSKVSSNLHDELHTLATKESILRNEVSDCVNRRIRATTSARAILKDLEELTLQIESLQIPATPVITINESHCKVSRCENAVMINSHTGKPFTFCKEHYIPRK